MRQMEDSAASVGNIYDIQGFSSWRLAKMNEKNPEIWNKTNGKTNSKAKEEKAKAKAKSGSYKIAK